MQLSKTDQVKEFIRVEDFKSALKITKTFRLIKKEDKVLIERAYEAYVRPEFYIQLGKDVECLKSGGIGVLNRLYGE